LILKNLNKAIFPVREHYNLSQAEEEVILPPSRGKWDFKLNINKDKIQIFKN